MLKIIKNKENEKLEIKLVGRLDTNTSKELEESLNGLLDGIHLLIFDFSELDYISSAGLRILLSCQKIMNRQGEMKVINVNEIVNDIFEVSGFCDILTIE